MSTILSIAASGMVAAVDRLQVTADNVANANSDGPLPSADPAVQAQYPAAYAPQQVEQVATAGGGTQAVVTPLQPPTIPAYDPAAPYADANGMVAAPNVNATSQAMQQVAARYDYAMNVQVMRVYSQMLKSLLDIET